MEMETGMRMGRRMQTLEERWKMVADREREGRETAERELLRLQGWVREMIDAHCQRDRDREIDALMMLGNLVGERVG